MPRSKADEPTAVDLYVGAQIRNMRNMRGLSQETLGKDVDLTFPQIQKYESGGNRVSASKLHAIAQALNCAAAELLPPPGWNGQKPVMARRRVTPANAVLLSKLGELSATQRNVLVKIADAFIAENTKPEIIHVGD